MGWGTIWHQGSHLGLRGSSERAAVTSGTVVSQSEHQHRQEPYPELAALTQGVLGILTVTSCVGSSGFQRASLQGAWIL